MDSELRQISTLVQERRYDEARAALEPYLRDHADSAYGWYLMSFAAKTPGARQSAIKKAVQLAPDNQKYTSRRAKLNASGPSSNTRLLVAGGVVMVTVLAVVFVLLRPSDAPADGSLPTLAVSETVANTSTLPSETVEVAAVASATAEILSPTTVIETATQTVPTTAAQVSSESTAAPTDSVPTFSAADVNPTADNLLFILPTQETLVQLPTANAASSGTPPPTTAAPIAPSSTPSQTPQPGLPTSTPVLIGEAGVALGSPLDIGTGTMRVVAATRPGSSFITEMGGQPGSLPAGQEWVVVEALLICSGSTNCAPDVSSIRVVNASGGTYSPAADFNMSQQFGRGAYALGQVWGYLGFRVPTSDTGLRLIISQNDKTYTFALT